MQASKITTVLLFVLVCATVPVNAREVVFEGAPPSNQKEIERIVGQPQIAPDSIARLLAAEGYLDAVVAKDDDGVKIIAGDRSYLERALWLDDSAVISGIHVPFTQENVERIIDERLAELREAGYYYSSATVTSVSRHGLGVDIQLRLTPGPTLTFGRNVFLGLTRTDPAMIERYVPPDSGDPITEARLRDAERRAAAIPFVLFRPPINIKPLPGYTDADLEYNFVEKKQVLVSGGAGYVPSASSSFVWNLDLAFQNVFGGGRMMRIQSERREEDRQILDIGYRQPVFLVGSGEAGVNVATRDYRDRFYEFSLKADWRTQVGRVYTTGLELGWRSVEPSTNEPSFNSFVSAFIIERNSIDRPSNPSSGSRLAWSISFGYRRYSDDTTAIQPEQRSFNETRTSVDAEWYQPMVSNLIGHLRASFKGFQTGESLPPLSELYLIGGPGSLRGYRNEQFGAIWTAYGSLEPRLRFAGGYLFVFYDAAYINNRVGGNGDTVTDEFYRHSFGLGTAIVDRSRAVKISVGWSPDLAFDQPRLSLEFSSEI